MRTATKGRALQTMEFGAGHSLQLYASDVVAAPCAGLARENNQRASNAGGGPWWPSAKEGQGIYKHKDTSHGKGATKMIYIREGLLNKDADGHKGPRPAFVMYHSWFDVRGCWTTQGAASQEKNSQRASNAGGGPWWPPAKEEQGIYKHMDTSHKKGATKMIYIREGLLNKDADGHKGPRPHWMNAAVGLLNEVADGTRHGIKG